MVEALPNQACCALTPSLNFRPNFSQDVSPRQLRCQPSLRTLPLTPQKEDGPISVSLLLVVDVSPCQVNCGRRPSPEKKTAPFLFQSLSIPP
jgi:hypothetical protein